MPEDTTKPTSDSPSFFRSGVREPVILTPGLEPGKIVGDFQLCSLLGQGGMGQVWEANQISLSRQVAVKFVRPERVTVRQLELFAREARAGGRLSHTGIVAVYGHGESDGLAWIAMELVPGAWDLRDFLDETARIGEVPKGYDRKVASFIAQVADAVQAAHDAGVIHRDLKPQNILIAEDDTPKVTDFGLARIVDEQALSHTGDFTGTYFYMSPEQVAARRAGIDHRTDVFSLGIVLYEMLSLVRPFQGDTEHQVAEQILMKDPPDPRSIRSRVPRDLAVICSKALEKDRDKRFASMAEIAADLRRWLCNEPIQAKLPTLVDRAVKWCKRNPAKSVAIAGACLTTLAISVLLMDMAKSDRELFNEKEKLIEALVILDLEKGKLDAATEEIELLRNSIVRDTMALDLLHAEKRALYARLSTMEEGQIIADSDKDALTVLEAQIAELAGRVDEKDRQKLEADAELTQLQEHNSSLRDRISKIQSSASDE